MKTGLDFGTVRMMLWVGSDDYTLWKYKRRNTVLGLWHGMKKAMWRDHLRDCEESYCSSGCADLDSTDDRE